MTAFFAALGRFSVRFRVLIVVAWLVGTGVALTSLPTLGSVTKDTTSGFLPASTPSVVAANMAKPFQSTSLAGLTLVASRSNGPLTSLDQNAITLIEHRVNQVAKVRSVRDLGVSRDGQARLALVQADVPRFGGSTKGPGEKLVTQIRNLFRHAPLPAGLALNLTGELPTTIDLNASQGKSRNNTQAFSFIFIILLLLLAYRALLAPLVTLFPAAVALAVSGPVIAQATHIGVQVSSITQFMLIVLILGAGTDYGVFLVFRVREELQTGLTPHDAVARAMARVGESITFSALTVMAALVSLVLARFGIYKSLGPSLAIGIAVMLLAGLTLLPAILALLGRTVFWPSRVRHVSVPKRSLYGRLIDPVVRRPVATLVAGVIGFVALAFGLVGTGTAGFTDTTTGPPGSDSAAGSVALATHFPGATNNATSAVFTLTQPVWANPALLTTAADQLQATGRFAKLIGALDPNGTVLSPSRLAALHRQLGPARDLPPVPPIGSVVAPALYNAYRSTGQYISPDGRTVQFSGTLADNRTDRPAVLATVPALRQAVDRIGHSIGASQSGVFGVVAFAYDVSHITQNDLTNIIPVVAVIIAILLALVMRSLVAPLYLVASVVLSYLAALGLVSIIFVHLGAQAGLNFVLSFLMFVFLMALGSDYNILVMSRIREEAKNLPLKEAVVRAISRTGGTVTTAGIILGGTFAVLAVAAGSSSGSGQIRQIGYGVAAGVLMDTFIVRTILVPSVVVILGRLNWWPSALYHRPKQ